MGCGIFRLFVGNSGNRHDPNKLSKGRWCLLPNQSPRGIIAYQLLTQCSIDSVAHCSFQPLQGFTFTVILRGFFPKVICYMVLDMANNDATSATVKVLVSFYFVLTDESSSSARTSEIHKGKLNAGVPLSGDGLNVLSSIVKHLKTFTGLAEIAKGKRLGENPRS